MFKSFRIKILLYFFLSVLAVVLLVAGLIGFEIIQKTIASISVYFIFLENTVFIIFLNILIKKIIKLKGEELMKNDFISFASHQLRTPLTVIKWNTEMLEDESSGKLSLKQKQCLKDIILEEKRISDLATSLLNMSRLESGRIKIDPEPADIISLVSETITELDPYIKAKHCEVKFEKPDVIPPVIDLDKSLFKHVILNLLNNAINYSLPEKCGIKVDFKEFKEYYQVNVADQGIGIPPDACDKIFNKFFRADNAIKVDSKGTGLGLYMTKLIVETSGGKIWFETKNGRGKKFQKAEGTTFHFTVPKTGMKKIEDGKGLVI